MKDETRWLAELMGAFHSSSEVAPRDATCPRPERVAAAARLELPLEGRREIIDHTAVCAACAEDWRIAAGLSRAEQVGDTQVAAALVEGGLAESGTYSVVIDVPWVRRLLPRAAVAAAAVAIVVGAGWLVHPVPEPDARHASGPVVRGVEGYRPTSTLTAEASLPREEFVLRWSPGPAGSRYELRATTESFEVLAEVEGLEQAELQVPKEALEALATGQPILWQVVATLPGGEHRCSETFTTMLE